MHNVPSSRITVRTKHDGDCFLIVMKCLSFASFLIITTLKHAYEYWALVCHNTMAHKFPSRFRLSTLLWGIIIPPSFRVTMGQQKFLSCEVFFDDQAIRMGVGSYGLLHINRLQYMTSDFSTWNCYRLIWIFMKWSTVLSYYAYKRAVENGSNPTHLLKEVQQYTPFVNYLVDASTLRDKF